MLLDWVGDAVIRKSTSGGVVCLGSHTISWWCKLQSNIALSSCEAEFNAALKGAVEGLNVQRLAATLGVGPRIKDGRVRSQRSDSPPGSWQGETPPRKTVVAARKRRCGGANNSEDPKN